MREMACTYLLNFWSKVLLFWQNNWILLPVNMTSLQSHTCAHFSADNLRQKLHSHINTFRTSWTHLCKNFQTFVKLFTILCRYAFSILLISNRFSLGVKWAQPESTLTEFSVLKLQIHYIPRKNCWLKLRSFK